MTQEGAVPPDFWQQINRMIDAKVAASTRAASIRNASISSGGTFSIVGGALEMKDTNGTQIFYVGPVDPNKADGTPQQGWSVRRADGTAVLLLRDQFPTDAGGALQQALNWFDRGGNVVIADDTNSGQGVARPWIGGGFARARYADMSITSTSSTFETLWDARISKQQPRLEVCYRGTMDTSGTTGETRVMVNGVQWGSTVSESFSINTHYVGPATVSGAHMSDLYIEIQGRRTSATGTLRVEALYWKGKQS